VTGIVGSVPVGGVAWDYFQYPIGLARLGHDVVYHEDTGNWPYDPLQVTAVEHGVLLGGLSYEVFFRPTRPN
jgi:hypothetical protein